MMIRQAVSAPLCACLLLAVAAWQVHGFAPVQLSESRFSATSRHYPTPTHILATEPARSSTDHSLTKDDEKSIASLVAGTPIVVGLFTSLPAEAAQGSDSFFPIASALIAYMHYAGMFSAVACLLAERMIIGRERFGEEDEELLTKVDIAYGLVGVPIVVSGYLRVTEFGKVMG